HRARRDGRVLDALAIQEAAVRAAEVLQRKDRPLAVHLQMPARNAVSTQLNLALTVSTNRQAVLERHALMVRGKDPLEPDLGANHPGNGVVFALRGIHVPHHRGLTASTTPAPLKSPRPAPVRKLRQTSRP